MRDHNQLATRPYQHVGRMVMIRDSEVSQERETVALGLLDISEYIGIQFEELNCYRLVQKIYQEKLSISLPDRFIDATASRSIFGQYIKDIGGLWERIDEPIPFCAVAMSHDENHPKVVQHFGIYIGDGMILHTLMGIGSHLVSINQYKYHIRGFYTWQR